MKPHVVVALVGTIMVVVLAGYLLWDWYHNYLLKSLGQTPFFRKEKKDDEQKERQEGK